ncbi:hypothetical protein B4113_1501 [Geobacillus sp. B4113_201601]|nr:hypothetical protein B4113_1501 [Geobacillus sp. B4113_201601]
MPKQEGRKAAVPSTPRGNDGRKTYHESLEREVAGQSIAEREKSDHESPERAENSVCPPTCPEGRLFQTLGALSITTEPLFTPFWRWSTPENQQFIPVRK